MAEGDSNAVGGIVWLWQGGEVKQALDHLLHLSFFGVTVTGDRLLDLSRGIFSQGNMLLRGGEQEHSPCLTDRDGGGDIATKEEFFNCNLIGLELGEQGDKILVELL